MYAIALPHRRDGASSPISSRVPNDNADDEEEDPAKAAAAALKNAGTKIKRGPQARRRDHHSLRPEKVVDILLRWAE